MKKSNLPQNKTLADVIKYEGIKAKGFGTIPKFITHDRDIPLESKAIYGYFGALCGDGKTTFPSRSKILSDLNLSKNGYYKHYKALIEQGYITVEKANPADFKSHNIYTIISNPKKFNESVKKNGRTQSTLLMGIDAYGYGILPRAVMIDERLDIKAKGIYCYMASYAGAGDTAFPEKKNILYHLKISENTYYRYLNQLIEYNYIIPIQRKEAGRYGVCDYILSQNPDEAKGKEIRAIRKEKISPSSKNQDIGEHMVKSAKTNKTGSPNLKKEDIEKHMVKPAKTKQNSNSPNLKKEDIEKEDIEKEDIEKEDTIINSVSTNNFSINSIYQYQEKTASPFDSIDTTNNVNNILNVLSTQQVADKISLVDLKEQYPDKHEDINCLFDCICDVLTVDNPVSPTLRISKQNIPFITVKDMFSLLEKKHIEYVIRSLNNNENKYKINKNTKSYLMTSLFHAPRTISYYFDRSFKKTPKEKDKWELLFERQQQERQLNYTNSITSDTSDTSDFDDDFFNNDLSDYFQ